MMSNFKKRGKVSSTMPRSNEKRYIYWKGRDAVQLGAMRRYGREKQELDTLLERIIAPVLAKKRLHILDAGCGCGHLVALLHAQSPASTFVGVDQTAPYIREARRAYPDSACEFTVGDIETLPRTYGKEFDISVSRAVISWIPSYEEFMRAVYAVTKKHIFVSSLFYDGEIDFEIKVTEYRKPTSRNEFTEYRNVYSLPRFERFVKGLGARKITVYDFDIGKDLPKPPKNRMGTYTVRLRDGKRLQISGAILMNWKWIRIDV